MLAGSQLESMNLTDHLNPVKLMSYRIFLNCCLGLTLLTSAALAQQFAEESSTRFPNPQLNEYTNQLTVGDIDLDGDLDLIFANGGNFFSQGPPLTQRVFVNDGVGNFTDESALRLNFSGIARGVEMGDIDDDGDLDLIFAQDFQMSPRLFENDGNGFFTDITSTNLPMFTLSSSRAQFGDLDNDGDLDLYVNNGGTSRFGIGQNRIYVNDGSGFFTDATADLHPTINIAEPMDVTFGDIDGDFDIDVRTGSTGNNNSRLFRNDGTGVLSLVSGVPNDSSCYSYDFGDIDGDGDLDMMGVNAGTGNTDLLLENDGTGSFTNISNQISPNPSLDDNDSKFLDYDYDGDLDLIVGRLGAIGERLYENDGNGNFTQTTGIFPNISDSTLDIVVADLTGDGRLDVVTAQGESGLFRNRIYINNGPIDNLPPRIIDTEVADTSTEDEYVIRALITDDNSSDRNFFDDGVILNFSVNAGPMQQAEMKFSGGTVYRGVVPEQNPGDQIEYFVTATDMAGNTGQGKERTVIVEGVLLGDINCDNAVNLLDVAPFVDLLSNGEFSVKGDIDGNGSVDLLDIAPFVDLLAGN